MLFLLNDVVFDLDETCPVTPGDARRFEKLGFDYVLTLGCELFAEDPLLHHNDPERARRLAWLIHDRSPEINAALFAAPATGAANRAAFTSDERSWISQARRRARCGSLRCSSGSSANSWQPSSST